MSSQQVNKPVLNPTPDDVKGEVYYFLTEAANAVLRTFVVGEIGTQKISLRKFLGTYSESDNVTVREFCESLRIDIDKIFNQLENLDGFQLSQAELLLDEYESGLSRIERAEIESKKDFLLDLTYNLRKDFCSYIDQYNEMVKRKSRRKSSTKTREVDKSSASFCFWVN